MPQKQTKIVATISDLNCSQEFIQELFDNGINVVRLNTAHQAHDDTRRVIKSVRAVSDKIALLVDTKGPEVRTQLIGKEGLTVKSGDRVIVSNELKDGEFGFGTNYDGFVNDVPVGSVILIDDGETGMTVVEKNDTQLICEIGNDGVIKNRKSANVPNVDIELASLTQKDRDYVDFCIAEDVDFIAHSFVRNAKDVLDIQAILDEAGSKIKIISKIENRAGVDNIEEILDVTYGVMVARGDLGIEVPEEEVPAIQKALIAACVRRGKPVITATQMLHTMIKNPRPTRAEVSDVANAVYDGTDAVMLSGETAYGEYPLESVQTMTRIIKSIEATRPVRANLEPCKLENDIHSFMAEAAVVACDTMDVKAMIIDTKIGASARTVSSYRGATPIFAQTSSPRVMRELSLSYGVYAHQTEHASGTDALVTGALDFLVASKAVEATDTVAVIGRTPRATTGANFFEITSASEWAASSK